MAYDYTALNGSADKTRAAEDQIRADLQAVGRGFRAMIRVGSNLQAIKDTMPHGEWEKWIDQALDLSARTARRYMQIAKKFRAVSMDAFAEEVLALLVPHDVPEKAVKEVVSKGAEAQPEKAKKIVEASKPPKNAKKMAPINRIAKHLSGDGPLEFASDEPEQTIEASQPESKPWMPTDPAPELASHVAASVPVSDKQPEISSIENEVLKAFSECKQQSDDSSEFAFEQAIEIIRMLSPEYHRRAKVIIDELVGTEASAPAPVGKTEAVIATAKPETTNEVVEQLEPGKLIPFDALDSKLPEKLDVPRFRSAWAKWVRFNELEGKPLNELVTEAQIKQLGARSMEAAVSAIETAIASRTTVLPKGKDSRPKSAPPTLEQLSEYANQQGYKGFDAQRFISYYESQGWKKKNGQPLVDWKAGVRNWMSSKQDELQKKPVGSAATNGAYKPHVPEPDRVRPHGRRQSISGNDSAAVAGAAVRHS